jgi:hypothetical protein
MDKTNNQIVAELAAVAGQLADANALPPNQQADALFAIYDAGLTDLVRVAGDRLTIVSATALATNDSAAAYDVLFERMRQQEQERFGPSHDDAHTNKELAYAASAYLGPIWGIDTAKPDSAPDVPPIAWPWGAEWWKPGGNDLESYRRRLVKGAALAIAEIERVDRMIASGEKADV